MEEYNPFDLSPPEQPGDQPTVPPAVVEVHKIGNEPILHERSTKIATRVMIIFLIGLFSYMGVTYLLGKGVFDMSFWTGVTNPQKAAVNSAAGSTPKAATQQTNQPKATAKTTSTTNAATSSSSGSAGTTATGTNCGVAGMPKGVCTLIESVEAKGVKNNDLVIANVSGLPDGAKVSVDRSSWQQTDAATGKLNFTISVLGMNFKGSGVIKNDGGIWKVISYTPG